MATAYKLASILTLIIALVYGRDVAEVFLEEEQSSYTDLLLLRSATSRVECIQKKNCRNKGGSCQKKGEACTGKRVKGCANGCSCCLTVTSRAECIQKKKCKNKGGTCQKKGTACTGKRDKGCVKGCYCCLPEEIICKRSKKCKKKNGACIRKGECNGKIIANGCIKPNSCMKTHVCCVEEKCPGNFADNFVCPKCDNQNKAQKFLKKNGVGPRNMPYLVFAGKDKNGNPISYTPKNDEECEIKEPVQAWSCVRKEKDDDWKCIVKGVCTADIELSDGNYEPLIGSLKCHCPNPFFEKKHVCKICKGDEAAKTHCEENRKAKKNLKNTVLDANDQVIIYDKQEGICTIDSPKSFKAWECDTIKKGKRWVWNECKPLGSCSNIQSNVNDGHLYYERMKCVQSTTYKPLETSIYTKQSLSTTAKPGVISITYKPLETPIYTKQSLSTTAKPDLCPNSNFTYNHVCETCSDNIVDFVISRRGQPPTIPGDHYVFIPPVEYKYIALPNYDYHDCDSNFTGSVCWAGSGITYICTVNASGYWVPFEDGGRYGCVEWGYCSALSLLSNGHTDGNRPCCDD